MSIFNYIYPMSKEGISFISEILPHLQKFPRKYPPIAAGAVTLCNSDDSRSLKMVGMMMRGGWLSSLTAEVDTSICKIASAH